MCSTFILILRFSQDGSNLSLCVGTSFIRDGLYYRVAEYDENNGLIQCGMFDNGGRTFYVGPGQHPVHENVRVNDISILFHPHQSSADSSDMIDSVGIQYNYYLRDTIPYINVVDNNEDDMYEDVDNPSEISLPQIHREAMLPELTAATPEDFDVLMTTPIVMEEFSPFRSGVRFCTRADDRSYVITRTDGTPVHSIECRDVYSGTVCFFKVRPHGKEEAPFLRETDVIEELY